jgi:sortase B
MNSRKKNRTEPQPVRRKRTILRSIDTLSWRFKKLNGRQRSAVLCALALIAVGGIGLIAFGMSLSSSRQAAQQLRAVNEQASVGADTELSSGPSAELSAPDTGLSSEPPAEISAEDTELSSESYDKLPAEGNAVSVNSETESAPKPARAKTLPAADYPENPRKTVSSRFQLLREKNRDIVGWLKMGGIVDEAVVQRDNVFYLDHDVLGRENVNGALFLDAGVALETRPYTYIIYGHNMRVGAEFGSLRNYENRSFYLADPFISFDTMYENGNYVIFAVGAVSVEESRDSYVDFLSLLFSNTEEHRRAIDTLVASSLYPAAVDTQAEDQLLLLVTCATGDDERRVVAARRIREGEKKEDLAQAIAASLQ